jgi:hypothetical protein
MMGETVIAVTGASRALRRQQFRDALMLRFKAVHRVWLAPLLYRRRFQLLCQPPRGGLPPAGIVFDLLETTESGL